MHEIQYKSNWISPGWNLSEHSRVTIQSFSHSTQRLIPSKLCTRPQIEPPFDLREKLNEVQQIESLRGGAWDWDQQGEFVYIVRKRKHVHCLRQNQNWTTKDNAPSRDQLGSTFGNEFTRLGSHLWLNSMFLSECFASKQHRELFFPFAWRP